VIVQVNGKYYEKLAFLDQSRFISKTIQDTAIVIVTAELICDLSNGTISK